MSGTVVEQVGDAVARQHAHDGRVGHARAALEEDQLRGSQPVGQAQEEAAQPDDQADREAGNGPEKGLGPRPSRIVEGAGSGRRGTWGPFSGPSVGSGRVDMRA